MMHAYTQPRTIDLVLADICANPVGTLIEDAVRSIAARIGRSAGGITPALKRLAADGWISYLSDGRGTLIEVLKSDQESDRSVFSEAPQAPADPASGCGGAPIAADQEEDRSASDQAPDRSPCMVDHDLDQQQQPSRVALELHPLYQRLTSDPDMNESLALRVADHAPGTLAEFEADLAAAPRHLRVRPLFWLAKIWASGKRPQARDRAPRRETAPRAAPEYYTPAPRASLSLEERRALAAQYRPFGGTP